MDFRWSVILDKLAAQDAMLGLFLLAGGLVFMLLGLRAFRALIAVSFIAIGFVLGTSLTGGNFSRIALGLVAAVGLGFASWRFTRVSVYVLAAGWAAFLVFQLTDALGTRFEMSLVISLFTVLVVVSLIPVMYQQIIALITSFEGSLLLLGGAIIMVSKSPSFWTHIRATLLENSIFGPFLIIAITFSGFYFQMAELSKKKTGMSG